MEKPSTGVPPAEQPKKPITPQERMKEVKATVGLRNALEGVGKAAEASVRHEAVMKKLEQYFMSSDPQVRKQAKKWSDLMENMTGSLGKKSPHRDAQLLTNYEHYAQEILDSTEASITYVDPELKKRAEAIKNTFIEGYDNPNEW